MRQYLVYVEYLIQKNVHRECAKCVVQKCYSEDPWLSSYITFGRRIRGSILHMLDDTSG